MYDIPHISSALEKFEIIPSTEESYITLSVGVFVINFESVAGQQFPIF